MLGIVNAKWGNALKSSMQDERMLGNRQYVRKKYSEISMQGDTLLENANVRRENAQNPQYKVKKCSESSM